MKMLALLILATLGDAKQVEMILIAEVSKVNIFVE
jgi:hypothetical protein